MPGTRHMLPIAGLSSYRADKICRANCVTFLAEMHTFPIKLIPRLLCVPAYSIPS